MTKHVIIVAQPRSGGVVSSQIIENKYKFNNLFEFFNTHRYGYDATVFDSEIAAKKDKVEYLLNTDVSHIVKVSWFDIKDISDDMLKVQADWYHVHRTNPVEMVISSYMSYISNIFHVDKQETGFVPLENIVVPIEYLEDFFSPVNYGGWHFNCKENIPILDRIDYKTILYNDTLTEYDMSIQVFGEDYSSDVTATKLYPEKNKTVVNIDEIQQWVTDNVYVGSDDK